MEKRHEVVRTVGLLGLIGLTFFVTDQFVGPPRSRYQAATGFHFPPPPDPGFRLSVPGLVPSEQTALSDLSSELTRRFTDRNNVTFGMSRVALPGVRFHVGPMGGRMPKEPTDTAPMRKSESGQSEVFLDGQWMLSANVKPQMRPENAKEQTAIDTFRQHRVEVAIYTAGQFSLDKGPHANHSMDKYRYGDFDDIRIKGPAYIRQDTPYAPYAADIAPFARTAWASGKEDYRAAGPAGWQLVAHRINAIDASCVSCHHTPDRHFVNPMTKENLTVNKVGDPIGLYIIALRKS